MWCRQLVRCEATIHLLRPVLSGESRHKEVRYFHIDEDNQFGEAQFVGWMRQASELPGERM